jgi:hypothetical protein
MELNETTPGMDFGDADSGRSGGGRSGLHTLKGILWGDLN